MGKVTFSPTFKEKERKNIYKKEEILFFASKCKLQQIPQRTPGPNFSPHTTHKAQTYTSSPDEHPTDPTDPQITPQTKFE